LDSLHYPEINKRYDTIAEAHKKTFDWIFDNSSTQRGEWSNFVDWLENGQGVYWINGKPGSGKSTMMRFIYDNGRTRHHLATWAKGLKLALAGFFFWSSGSMLEKSQICLFR